jgi:hypothetical protein
VVGDRNKNGFGFFTINIDDRGRIRVGAMTFGRKRRTSGSYRSYAALANQEQDLYTKKQTLAGKNGVVFLLVHSPPSFADVKMHP